MEILNNKLINNQFAPGIATYGIDGKDGSIGDPGTSIYFTSYALRNSSKQLVQSQLDEVLIKIRQNKILSSYVNEDNPREYRLGDLILDSGGDLFRIENKNNIISLSFIASIKGINDATYFTNISNRTVLNSTSTKQDSTGGIVEDYIEGLDIINGVDPSTIQPQDSSKYQLRVINTIEDQNTGDFNLVSLRAKSNVGGESYLNIRYNQYNDTFVFDTNSRLNIDAKSLRVKTSESLANDGEFYPIEPYDDPIGLLHRVYSKSTVTVGTLPEDSDTQAFIIEMDDIDSGFWDNICPDYLKVKKVSSNRVLETCIFEINKTDSNLILPRPESNQMIIFIPQEGIDIKEGETLKFSLVKGIEVEIKES